MDIIHVAPEFESWFPQEARRSIEAMALHLDLNLDGHHKRTLVKLHTLTNTDNQALSCYFKVYATRQNALDGLGRRSRGVLEARNLNNFNRWGIAAPAVIAWGSGRGLGGLCTRLSFLITQAAESTLALRDYWLGLDEPAAFETRRHLIDQLAMQTRRLHEHQFYHQDLKWRNLLVDTGGSRPTCWWIDCPNGYFSRLTLRQKHGRIKDLATLDKVAKDRCTSDERLRFLQVYLNEPSMTPTVEAWAETVVRYRKHRQDD